MAPVAGPTRSTAAQRRFPGPGTLSNRRGHCRERRRHRFRRLAPPALHPPAQRRPRRHGLPRPDLPARAPPPHPDPGRHLPHPLLRRAHPPPGPHHPLAPRRPTTSTNGAGLCEACNHTKETPGWRARAMTEHGRHDPATPDQTQPDPARRPAHPRTHHPHRPHLPLHRTTPAGDAASPNSRGTARHPATGASSGTRPKRSNAASSKRCLQPRNHCRLEARAPPTCERSEPQRSLV